MHSLLGLRAVIPVEYRGADSTMGLLGVYDGNRDNDFKLRNGDTLVPAGSEQEYFQFGQNCKFQLYKKKCKCNKYTF